jgi:hypothetical protein
MMKTTKQPIRIPISYMTFCLTRGASGEDPEMAIVEDGFVSATNFATSDLKSTASQSYVPLRKNLASAFRYLRDKSKHRRMWVDAICINQQDEIE